MTEELGLRRCFDTMFLVYCFKAVYDRRDWLAKMI